MAKSKKSPKALEETAEAESEDKPPPFSLEISRDAVAWLIQANISLALTTYQAGKMLFFGVKPDNTLWVHNRNIGSCLGMSFSADGQAMWCSSNKEIYKFQNVLGTGEVMPDGRDALYVPQVAYYTGDIDVHDMFLDADGRLLFANTLFNCVATISATHSFEPLWQPSFISDLAAEDRCHLNGLAMKDGRLKYVSVISASNTEGGWRDNRDGGGLIIDVESNEVVAQGLSMPHSPRWYRDRLWVLNSGTGEFGFINRDRQFEAIAFCPGYLRGLAFCGDYAIVGLSKPRDKTFAGLPLDEALAGRGVEARCGVYVIDIRPEMKGAIVYSFIINGAIVELYDVVTMHGFKTPAAISPLSDEDMGVYISVGDNAIL